jgi:hypothetical protein
MGDKSEGNYNLLVLKLQEKHKELTGYRQDILWKFTQREAPEAYEENFDDSSWETFSLPRRIDVRKGARVKPNNVVVSCVKLAEDSPTRTTTSLESMMPLEKAPKQRSSLDSISRKRMKMTSRRRN